MGFPGVWMTESESLIYRVVPKCACSTIGQVMFFSDHGRFFDGDIHDAATGLHKWSRDDSRGPIEDAVRRGNALAFTCVRNPYARILSSFFDQIASFRRFLLFARDTIRWRKPMDPDIHWSSISGHVGAFVRNGGHYDRILFTETLGKDMAQVLQSVRTPVAVDMAAVPRFNESEGHGPRRAHPISAYFDDLTRHLVWDIYKDDFQLFGYDFDDPDNRMPDGSMDLERVHARLRQ